MKWVEPIQRFLQSKGLDSAKCADLSQDAFIRLWNNCSKVGMDKVKSFLFTVASNLSIDEFRKEKTQLKLKAKKRTEINFQDGQYQLEMEEFRQALEKAINSMTPGSKEVFVLHRFNDMSYKEIANQLSISIKAVEKRMSKALAHLVKSGIRK